MKSGFYRGVLFPSQRATRHPKKTPLLIDLSVGVGSIYSVYLLTLSRLPLDVFQQKPEGHRQVFVSFRYAYIYMCMLLIGLSMSMK